MPNEIERMMREALVHHGIDPEDPEIAKEIRRILGIIGTPQETPICPLCSEPPTMQISNISMCGNLNCTVIYWDNTMTLDQLLLSPRLVQLPTGDSP